MLHAVGLLQSFSSIPLLPWQAKRKKKGNLDTLKSFFFRESYIWELEPAVFFFYHHSLLQYITSPCIPSLLLLSFLSVSLFLPSSSILSLWLCLVLSSAVSPSSVPLHFPVPRFLSLGGRGGFWIREAFSCQAATILHVNEKGGWKHSGSSTGTFFFQLVCHASLCCGGKESVSFTAPLHLHQRQKVWLHSY